MNPLRQLQDDAVAYLLGNPVTAVVNYDSFRKQATESAVKEAIGGWEVRVPGKIGVACLVLMPSFYAKDPNVPGVQGSAELIIRTFEDPKVNNMDISAEDVALANLQWFGDGVIIAGLLAIYPDNKGPALRPNYDYPGFLVYDTVVSGELPQDFIGRTVDPAITEVAGTVTLACTDAAAVIYYTIGGASVQPGDQSGKGNTLVYNAPFNVPSSTVIRAVAYNPALLPSNIDQVTINY